MFVRSRDEEELILTDRVSSGCTYSSQVIFQCGSGAAIVSSVSEIRSEAVPGDVHAGQEHLLAVQTQLSILHGQESLSVNGIETE